MTSPPFGVFPLLRAIHLFTNELDIFVTTAESTTGGAGAGGGAGAEGGFTRGVTHEVELHFLH